MHAQAQGPALAFQHRSTSPLPAGWTGRALETERRRLDALAKIPNLDPAFLDRFAPTWTARAHDARSSAGFVQPRGTGTGIGSAAEAPSSAFAACSLTWPSSLGPGSLTT